MYNGERMKNLKACKKCGKLLEKEERICPICNNTKFTTFWQGCILVINPEKSEIARLLDIKTNGKYALRVS